MKHIPRKRFGQNFLVDAGIIYQIIQCINPQTKQNIVEIGPGFGALTKPLLDLVPHLEVIELDRDIISYLKSKFNSSQLTIHQGDALKFDYSFNHKPLRVIGNLPYNISTPLLFHLSHYKNIVDMTFMLQKEVVDRICAQPNSSDYGRLSIMLQCQYQCRNLLSVPPESFEPKPKVNSAIVCLKPKADFNLGPTELANLNKVVSLAFNQRRKTIANSLKAICNAEFLIQLGIDPKLRAENITVSQYINLSLSLSEGSTCPRLNKNFTRVK